MLQDMRGRVPGLKGIPLPELHGCFCMDEMTPAKGLVGNSSVVGMQPSGHHKQTLKAYYSSNTGWRQGHVADLGAGP